MFSIWKKSIEFETKEKNERKNQIEIKLKSKELGEGWVSDAGIRNTTRSYLVVSNTRSYMSYLDTRYDQK